MKPIDNRARINPSQNAWNSCDLNRYCTKGSISSPNSAMTFRDRNDKLFVADFERRDSQQSKKHRRKDPWRQLCLSALRAISDDVAPFCSTGLVVRALAHPQHSHILRPFFADFWPLIVIFCHYCVCCCGFVLVFAARRATTLAVASHMCIKR